MMPKQYIIPGMMIRDMLVPVPLDWSRPEGPVLQVFAREIVDPVKRRENLPVLAAQKGRLKIHPIIDWTDMDVGAYLTAHNLPYHPLWDDGYVSIGDWHTTTRLADGMSPEDTRFHGLKRECGLNEDLTEDFVI